MRAVNIHRSIVVITSASTINPVQKKKQGLRLDRVPLLANPLLSRTLRSGALHGARVWQETSDCGQKMWVWTGILSVEGESECVRNISECVVRECAECDSGRIWGMPSA